MMRGLVVMIFGVSLLCATGCDKGDDPSDEARVGADDGDVSANELIGCALNETVGDCMAELGCAPVFGQPLLEDLDGAWCTETAEQFIGCASTLDLCPGKTGCEELCPSIDQTLCDGDSYWRAPGCVPDNLAPCEVPGEITDC